MVSCTRGLAEEQRLLESCGYVGPGYNHGQSHQPQSSVSGEKKADQLFLITQVLGDPCETYGFDERGKSLGGGRWDGGTQMARDNFGFTFQKGWLASISSCHSLALMLLDPT